MSSEQEEDGLGLNVIDAPPERVGRSATPEDLGRGKGRGARAAAKDLEVGDEVAYWPVAGTSVPARVIRSAPGGRLDVAYRYRGKLEVAEGVERKAKLGGWSLPGEMPESDEPMAGGKPIRVGARACVVLPGRGNTPKARTVEGRIVYLRKSDSAVYLLEDGAELPFDFEPESSTGGNGPRNAPPGLHVAARYGHSERCWHWVDDPKPKPAPSVNRPGARGRSTRSGAPLGAGRVAVYLASSRPIVGPRNQHHTRDGSTPVAELTPEEANELLEWLRSGYRLRGPSNMAGLFNPR